ncbi:MAG: metallophosphoesterase [Bacillota bacterium]
MRENAIRRLFPRRVLRIVIPGLVLLLLFGLAAGSGGVVAERVELPLPGLPAELNGLTVVHISDLHYGFGLFCNEDSVAQITRRISSLDPDLIVFTGDLLDRAADPALADTLPLEGLKARLGVYAVMGNHDHHFGKEKIARSLADSQLSGHSHGGQIRLPGVGAMYCPPLGRAYPLGLREVPGSRTLVYTNRGLGTTVLPLRLFSPPEVTLLTLRSGSGN